MGIHHMKSYGIFALVFLGIVASALQLRKAPNGMSLPSDAFLNSQRSPFGKDTVSLTCGMCHLFLNSFRNVLESETLFDIFKFLTEGLCSVFYSRYFCDTAESNIVKPILRNLVDRFLYPNITCVQLDLCKYPILTKDSDKEYADRVLKSKPPVFRPAVEKNPEKLRIIVFTDVHIDYNYKEGEEAECPYPVCCRKNSGLAEVKGQPTSPKAGKWGAVAKCDLPAHTMYHFINYTVNELKPDFFIWLGDNTGHNLWEHERVHHLDPVKDITEKFKVKYGNLGQMYPILGNHEGLPCDEFDIYSSKHQWILDNSTEMWKGWLTPDSQATFKKMGCYSQLHPNSKLRIIGLFPLAMDATNPYLWKNATNPWHILDWLENELDKSEKSGEAVFILNHFSSNTFFMNKQWGFRYGVLIDRYTNLIRGIFSGHTHEDSFQILRSKASNEVTGVIHVLPALATFPRVNPSFRLYEVDKKTYTAIDYVQYRLYIDEANKNETIYWRQAYRFSDFYGLPNLDYYRFPSIVAKMQTNPAFFTQVMNLLWAEGPRGPELLANHPHALKYMTCHYTCTDLFEFNDCVGWDLLKLEYWFGYGILVRYGLPEWGHATYEQQYHCLLYTSPSPRDRG
eukprot:TRINITY_DN170_c0_g3_i1.p1 TRINITY_DN170_c0_g3~~TRINITY_DN170_c0_g3_i1.p1  ORF type:complete len:654 (-),score=102.60 TRINITY_DN170_c0_g3_i1:24-1892(-)